MAVVVFGWLEEEVVMMGWGGEKRWARLFRASDTRLLGITWQSLSHCHVSVGARPGKPCYTSRPADAIIPSSGTSSIQPCYIDVGLPR